MFVVTATRTQAGAMKRMAERGRTFSLPMPAPKPVPTPRRDVVTYLPSHALAERRAIQAWKPESIVVEPIRFSSPSTIIARVVVWHRHVTFDDVMSERRTRRIVAARFDAIAAVHENCRIDGRRYSLLDLGRAFGRDHTSILNALRKRGIN